MKEAVIVSAARTPIGSFGGAFQHVSAVDLGKTAVKEAVRRAGLPPEAIEEAVLGNVLSAGLGQNVARQIAVHAGLPYTVPAMTINKVCGSGLRSVSMAAQFIKAGDAEVVLAGGAESMSNAPYVMPKARWGTRMGSAEMVDTMLQDGLIDAFEPIHMGITAENIAERWSFSRREQDEFALRSQQRAAAAIDNGYFEEEIVPMDVPQRKGESVTVSVDEHPKKDMTMEKLERLRPAFKKDGTVTAGNASGLNDGAAALVVMSREKAEALGLTPLATIVSYGNAALDPAVMGYGPVPASRQALERAGLTMEDIDLVEANEAFASQSLAVAQDLEIDADKINVNGGAIALGHPIGASGARVLTSLLYEMKRRNVKRGLAALCIGGGQGTAIIVER